MARILVVDDDHDVLKLVERVFSQAGHVVLTADDPFKAMATLDQNDFDLLISDANMPHFSGFELVQTLRRNARYEHMAIAMLTGLRERKDIDKALKAGVDDYIVKPIDPLILLQKVSALFEKRPPEQRPEAVFAVGDVAARAVMTASFRLESVSELGAVVVTPWQLTPGQIIDIKCPFFDQMGADAPPMKVLSSELINVGGEWRGQLIFLGAREVFLQKIRRYIFSHSGTLRSSSKAA
jgi:CheY-like chemotaxis protein